MWVTSAFEQHYVRDFFMDEKVRLSLRHHFVEASKPVCVDGGSCAFCGNRTQPFGLQVVRYAQDQSAPLPAAVVPLSESHGSIRGSLAVCSACALPCGKCGLPITTSWTARMVNILRKRYPNAILTLGEGYCRHMHWGLAFKGLFKRVCLPSELPPEQRFGPVTGNAKHLSPADSDATEAELVFITARVQFHKFFAGVINRAGGFVSPPTLSAVSDPAYPLAIQTAFMAFFYARRNRDLSLEQKAALRKLASKQLIAYWQRVQNKVGAVASFSPFLSATPDTLLDIQSWEKAVCEAVELESSGASRALDRIYFSIEEKSRFELHSPSDREKFYGPVFEAVTNTIEGMEINFSKNEL